MNLYILSLIFFLLQLPLLEETDNYPELQLFPPLVLQVAVEFHVQFSERERKREREREREIERERERERDRERERERQRE